MDEKVCLLRTVSKIMLNKSSIYAANIRKLQAAQNSGSIAIYNQLAASSKNPSPAETSSSNQRRKKALPIGNLKNRWGFKGKSITESERYLVQKHRFKNVDRANSFCPLIM